MSGFTAAELETLDFDFTGIPSATQPTPTPEEPNPPVAYCTGKGVVPEPSTARLGRFYDYLDEGRKTIRDAIAAQEHGDDPTGGVQASARLSETLDRVRAALADVCGGHPSRAEIDELPPRALAAFFGWLAGELVPKG